jgi:hypothetical protein
VVDEAVRLRRLQKCDNQAVVSCKLLPRRRGSSSAELLRCACKVAFLLENAGS